jgi:hypothetical protein
VNESADWVSLLVNPEPIRAIFGTHTPSLTGIEVHDLLLGRDGPSLVVRFDLPDYPADPPRKWVEAEANRVQLRLRAVEVRALTVNGVGWATATTMTLEPEDGGVRLRLDAADTCLDALAGWAYVDEISAYLQASA